MIVILARATARYEGRIDAELNLGDICLLIRDYEGGGDGSVLLHDMSTGIPPRNWMPAGSTITETESGFVFEHVKREERLEVWIDTVYSHQYHHPHMKTQLTKLGAEREFSDLLSTNLDHIEPQLTLVAREWRTTAGPVDLLCTDIHGNPLCIEVKRRRIDPNAVWQMRRYLDALRRMPEWEHTTPHGVMVAPVLANAAKKLVEDDRLIRFVRLSYQDVCAD